MTKSLHGQIARHLARVRRGDDGLAMIMVIGTMFALTLLVTSAFAMSLQGNVTSRRTQAYQVAAGAAQAAIDDYLQRLSVCDTYWRAPCGNSAPDLTRDASGNQGVNWVSVPGSGSGVSSRGQYTYKLLNPSTSNILRLLVKGRSVDGSNNPATRTYTVDLAKPGLLNYIYYTDLESLDPTLYSEYYPAERRSGSGSCGPTIANNTTCYPDTVTTPADLASLRNNCGADVSGANERYYYNGRNSASWTRSWIGKNNSGGNVSGADSFPCLEIQFAGGDVISGAFHTNDSMQINGAKFLHPRVTDRTETSWSTTAPVQPSNPSNRWWGSGPVVGGSPTGYSPVYAGPITLPPNNTAIRAQADPLLGGEGCMYTGPTRIVFRSDGRMTVTSPYTRQVNPRCSTSPNLNAVDMSSPQTVPGPINGVIYVQSIPTSASDPNALASGSCSLSVESSSVGYPVSGDITPYSCSDGDAFVSGSGFSGRFTVATANNINIVGPLTYSSRTGTDTLGLVANGFVQVHHPVDQNGNNLTSAMRDVEIDAAILSVQDSFVVPHWQYGAQQGTLTVYGGIYQKYRGPVGTGGGSCSSGTGYCKNYAYDSRLGLAPPPFFLNPVNAQWRVVSQGEQVRQ